MHTFLLGMVQNETKLCLSSLSGTKLLEFYKRLKNIKVPYDMGRLPNNINSSEGLSGLTAQQWKNFACLYARPCLSGLISANAYKSYCLLCEIIELLIKPTFTSEEINELFRLLNEHHKLFATVYGKWEVTINYHMTLHIPDVIYYFGPSHGYCCFAYERLNGFLSDIPNNNQNIELQIMNKFLHHRL